MKAPREVLNFGTRRWRLLAEILAADADVVALEEVDHFDDFFEPALKPFGYLGVFAPKRLSPAREFGYYSDGVALFWRAPSGACDPGGGCVGGWGGLGVGRHTCVCYDLTRASVYNKTS